MVFDLYVHSIFHVSHERLTFAVSDSAAHLAEEVKDAATSVPRAMVWSFIINGTLGLLVLLSFLFCIPDISVILDPEQNPSGYPIVYVFQQASYHGSIPLLVLLLITNVAGTIDSNCSTSRQIFAFARDGGFPFQSFLTKVSFVSIMDSLRDESLLTGHIAR